MPTNTRSHYDRDDDFELPPLPRFVDYDEFLAQWEEEGRQYKRHILKQSAKPTAKGICADLEFDHWVVTDRKWADTVSTLHAHWQALHVASPLDDKVRLQTETAIRWVERDAYEHNPQQWDSDGNVWVRTAVVQRPLFPASTYHVGTLSPDRTST